MPTILVKHAQTPQQRFNDALCEGKKRGRVAGGWIDDLAAQKRVITLCPLCTNKFNPARVGYRREKEFPTCQATCDGCSTFDTRCSMYIYEPLYTTVRSTADDRRELQRKRALGIQRGYL